MELYIFSTLYVSVAWAGGTFLHVFSSVAQWLKIKPGGEIYEYL